MNNQETLKTNKPIIFKGYIITGIIAAGVPLIFSLFLFATGSRQGFYGPSEQDIALFGILVFGPALSLGVGAYFVKHKVLKIITATISIIPAVLLLILMILMTIN